MKIFKICFTILGVDFVNIDIATHAFAIDFLAVAGRSFLGLTRDTEKDFYISFLWMDFKI